MVLQALRFHIAKIQRSSNPIVHPKMHTGKETVANAEFGMRSAECAIRPSRLRVQPVSWLEGNSGGAWVDGGY